VITLGLLAVGAAVGAIAGALVVVVGMALTDGVRTLTDPFLPGAGGLFGAIIGASLAPLAGWLLLRHVALGRAISVTALGTVAGGITGWTTRAAGDEVSGALLVGIVGFLVAALYLRAERSRRARSSDAAA
jgi:hypothetical protein